MGYIQILFAALGAIPKIVDALVALVSRADEFIELQQLRAEAKQLGEAIEKAKTTKDTSDIERLLARQ